MKTTSDGPTKGQRKSSGRFSDKDLAAVWKFCAARSWMNGSDSWLEAIVRGNRITIVEYEAGNDSDAFPLINPELGMRIAVLRYRPEDNEVVAVLDSRQRSGGPVQVRW